MMCFIRFPIPGASAYLRLAVSLSSKRRSSTTRRLAKGCLFLHHLGKGSELVILIAKNVQHSTSET
jgi:hypothetical protein